MGPALTGNFAEGSGLRTSSPHEIARHILSHAALVIGDPIFCDLLRCEALHHRRITSGHHNLNCVGHVLLRNNPIRRAGMRMFFCHTPNMVIEGANPKCRSQLSDHALEYPRLVWRYGYRICLEPDFDGSKAASNIFFAVQLLGKPLHTFPDAPYESRFLKTRKYCLGRNPFVSIRE